ncbi:MAG: bifunctional glutamate N-acetyltransferase/amino-acid acetyltransferase ArgJ [Candidatus Omnitrophica bacterium]|jgi:glutamate N-acetyltransferase/amino-acid N-acetyltransferase|nr:bifunctional glutamate N-acetyltransferase/amino-acid acetyltransferase ArgJ [Candidatus Omnitrophota bacterium]
MTSVFKKVILPLGFQANGLSAGLKRKNKLDLALLYSVVPAKASCLFTRNKILAAPIIVCKKHLKNNQGFQAVIANSGNANCFTGAQGIKDALAMAASAGSALGVKKEAVLVASTGIIGRKLPIDKIKKAMPVLVSGLTESGVDKAKKAIMTTDTFSKEITVKFVLGGKTITCCGIAKGAGMIAPDMATMLCFILTDAQITQGALNKALQTAVEKSFNCITVDGCMSTNDTVMVLANGMAGNKLITAGSNFAVFSSVLNKACLELAKMIVRDAEGATKFVHIKVIQAKSAKEAKTAALSIANSALFKTAMFASSPNIMGRITAAIGASGVAVKEQGLRIKYSPLKKKEVNIEISLGCGKARAEVYTSDLSYEYVKINAEYN